MRKPVGMCGIAVDITAKPSGLRGDIFQLIHSCLVSEDIIELNELVEDIVTRVNDYHGNPLKELPVVKSELEEGLKKNKMLIEEIESLHKTLNDLEKRNARQHDKEQQDYSMIVEYRKEICQLQDRVQELEGKKCMSNPNADSRATVNVYVDDYEKLQRKVNVLLEAIQKL